MPFLRFFSLFALALLTACGSGEPRDRHVRLVVDVQPLGGAPVAAVEEALGGPSSVTPITDIPDQMPGEIREYRLPGIRQPTAVRFHRGRAAFFAVPLPAPVATAEEALQMVGLRPDELTPLDSGESARWWIGNGFVRIGTLADAQGNYYQVQADVADAVADTP